MILIILLNLWPTLYARPSYQTLIPNGGNVMVENEPWPGVGHERSSGGGPRNVFGIDFDQAGRTWSKELCEKDSDGDGKSNGVELGDPQCIWKEGDTPQFDKGITHPGYKNAGIVTATDPCDGFSPPPNAKSTDLVMDKYSVLAKDTSYIKQAFTFPEEGNVVRIDILIDQPDVVHHIILYKCSSDVSNKYGTPAEGPMPCEDVVFAWAVGGKDYCFPGDLSVYMSKDEPFLAMEIHYDNPKLASNYVDSSGLRLQYVPGNTLTPATWLWVGARTGDISIPPKQTSYELTAECDLSAYAKAAQGKGEVKLFANVLHGHKLARKIWVTLERPNYKADVACNTNYDFDLQEMIAMPDIPISTGDKLTIHCVYDSSSADSVTVGGDATHEEMCIGLFMFYPQIAGTSIKCFSKANPVTYSTKTCDMYDPAKDPGATTGPVRNSATNHFLKMKYLICLAFLAIMW